MADPRQNYLQQLRAYAQPTPVYAPADIPASVRTYSVFDPNSNTWRRMTNDGRSPIPAQGQVAVPVQVPAQPAVDPVVAALAMAQQTRGRDWSRPLPQTPAQMPSRGSVRPSPASGGEGASVSLSPASEASQRASQRGFKASGQPDEYLSVGLPTALQPVAYPEGYRAVVSPDNQIPTYTINRNGVAVPNVSGIPLPEQVIRENARKATPPNLIDVASKGIPAEFYQKPVNTPIDTSNAILDSNDEAVIGDSPANYYSNDTIYDEANSNVWKTGNRQAIRDMEDAIGTFTAVVPIPILGGASQIGRGLAYGGKLLANTRRGQQLLNRMADAYRITRNSAVLKGKRAANRVADAIYHPRYAGAKGFERYAQDQAAAERFARMTAKPTEFEPAETLFRTPGF